MKFMVIVGSSIATNGNASDFSGLANVSPISTSSNPAMAPMSPAFNSFTSILLIFSNEYILEIFEFTFFPSFVRRTMLSPVFIDPL